MATTQTEQRGPRRGEERYNCDRCDFQYPRSQVIVQNGLIVCSGPGTNNCRDMPGRDALRKDYPRRTEENPPDLPIVDEDL